ncbi:uncharacterized protein isoform X2 [Leptinotarsa decemlineata]|uniref:uncharacterized protein isoform X2 n=1 Tax=Leptinotarsa decemlineata TaxID=7539 RepID=UPI003D305D96
MREQETKKWVSNQRKSKVVWLRTSIVFEGQNRAQINERGGLGEKRVFQHAEEDEDNRETEDEETEITPAPPPLVGASQALAAKHAMAPP